MQEHVGKHAQRPVSRRVVVLVAEDRRVDLRLRRIFQPLDLFLRLGGDVGFEGLNVVFHAGGDAVHQPDFPVLSSERR